MSRLWNDLVVVTCLGAGLIACSGGSGMEGPITGTVVDSDGKPAVGTVMSLHRNPANDGDRLWRSYSSSRNSVFVGFQGGFSIPDSGEAGPWILKADHKDYARIYLEVERGQTGIELTLEKGWNLTGTVVWGKDSDMEGCFVQLMQEPDLRSPMDSNGTDFVEMGEAFDLNRIANGEYTLKIGSGQGGAVLHSQELRLEGEGGHLDLGTIDLRGEVAQTTFTLAPGFGEDDGVFAVVDRDGSILKGEFGRTLTVVYPKETRELALWVDGYRTLLVDELQRELEVALEPGILVSIEIESVRNLPEDVFVTTVLERVEDPESGPALPGYLTERRLYSPGLEHHVSEPGQYRLHVALGLVKDGFPAGLSPTMTYLTPEANAPIIEVKEALELQVIHNPIEEKVVMDAIAELRELESKNRN